MTDGMSGFSYYVPTRVACAAGCWENFHEIIPSWRRPVVVTGKGARSRTGWLDPILNRYPDAVVFDQVEENPGTETCDRGALLARENACDGIIALGGGSAMDAGKVIAVLATDETRRAEDLFGNERYSRPPLPIVAIPTTAGTGSEVTPYSVLIDPRDGMKRTVRGNALFPGVALLDPILSVSMPRQVTIASGLDALSQCMEGMVSRASTPPGDALATAGCAMVTAWLPLAADHPERLDARQHMLVAACLSGMVIAQSGTTMIHGMGYYYTLRHGIPHGLANALLLPPVFAFNAQHAPDKIASLLAAMNPDLPVKAMSPLQLGQAIARALHDLYERLGISPAARDYGVPESVLGTYAREIAGDPYRFRNQPGPIDRDTVFTLYRHSWSGTF
ncbi:MAG TPA: iron-containing alcohol dehydrogenase [Candidatus Hydrogenedentes bacterium]|nr:iron-containing alcohol dehydrogenase [Candidatus Hydrogenedentota bacterium]